MINQKESKNTKMGSWLLKLLKGLENKKKKQKSTMETYHENG